MDTGFPGTAVHGRRSLANRLNSEQTTSEVRFFLTKPLPLRKAATQPGCGSSAGTEKL